MRRLVGLIAAAFALAAEAPGAELTGRVADAVSGESLERVIVRLVDQGREAATDSDGRFAFAGLAAGVCQVRTASVGYRPAHQTVVLDVDDAAKLEIRLQPSTLQRSEQVTVTAGPFARESEGAVALVGAELRNTAGVLSDDPFRAVQSLPGVTSNDDFQSQFAVRGADFSRVGVYLDGVLLRSPFHTVQGDPGAASASIINGDVLEGVELYASAPPVRYPDRSAAALDMRMRDGARDRFHVRGVAGMSNASLLLEGPIGKKGSFLAAARKSYLKYLIELVSDDDDIAFGFTDFEGRIAYQLDGRNRVSLSLFDGFSSLDQSRLADRRSPNSIIYSNTHFTVANLTHQYASKSLLLSNTAAWMRERYGNDNKFRRPLDEDLYGEWIWNGDAAWSWSRAASLEGGWSFRRVRENGYSVFRRRTEPEVILEDEFRGSGLRSGGYLQQTWRPVSRLRVAAGARLDRHGINGVNAVSPYASAGLRLASATRLRLAWGQTAQYAEPRQFYSRVGSTDLLPERSVHAQASLEQSLTRNTRLVFELYNRADRDLIVRPFAEARLRDDGSIYAPALATPILNARRGYSRGGQIVLQRRSANSLSGWVSYGFGKAKQSQEITGDVFDADFDQRHSVNGFAAYRLRPKLNVSAKYVYGSGLPVRGYFRLGANERTILLAQTKNDLRIPYYQRVDLRLNKAFVKDRTQFTLFVELVNLFARDNIRLADPRPFNARTGVARPELEESLPFLPAAGLSIEF